jgi:hypothetical protein
MSNRTQAQEPGLASPATRRSTTIRAGATLGHVPDRSAKALVAAGLAARGFEAHYMIEGPDGPFRVVSAGHEPEQDITAARAFISGALFCLFPPDPLADVVRTYKSEWAIFTGVTGRAVPGWSFSCGNPACILVATVRLADAGRAVGQVETLGWRHTDDQGWLCPTCAGR